MNKSELAQRVAQKHNLPHKDVLNMVQSIFDEISSGLEESKRVHINDFGTFDTRQKDPRICQNPTTREKIQVPAKMVPVFRASKQLKERIYKTGE